MKTAIIAFLFSAVALANSPKVVEAGLYKAYDLDTQSIEATLIVRADKTLNFSVVTPDFEMPAPGCEGTYKIEGNNFLASLTCPTDFLPEANVVIDITNVTPETVRSAEGVNVNVTIDALGEDPFAFNLRKVE